MDPAASPNLKKRGWLMPTSCEAFLFCHSIAIRDLSTSPAQDRDDRRREPVFLAPEFR